MDNKQVKCRQNRGKYTKTVNYVVLSFGTAPIGGSVADLDQFDPDPSFHFASAPVPDPNVDITGTSLVFAGVV